MAGCREHYDVLLVDVRCNLIGEVSLRSITKHQRTPCMQVGALIQTIAEEYFLQF